MPVIYALDPKQKLIRTRCVGNVTLPEVLAHFHELAEDPNAPGLFDVFLDLSETTSLPAGFQIAAVADQIKKTSQIVRFNACAIVAQQDALFGMLRMLEVLAEPYFGVTRVFRISAEAEAWLESVRLVKIPSEFASAKEPGQQSGY
jgi:hypothetical protein